MDQDLRASEPHRICLADQPVHCSWHRAPLPVYRHPATADACLPVSLRRPQPDEAIEPSLRPAPPDRRHTVLAGTIPVCAGRLFLRQKPEGGSSAAFRQTCPLPDAMTAGCLHHDRTRSCSGPRPPDRQPAGLCRKLGTIHGSPTPCQRACPPLPRRRPDSGSGKATPICSGSLQEKPVPRKPRQPRDSSRPAGTGRRYGRGAVRK